MKIEIEVLNRKLKSKIEIKNQQAGAELGQAQPSWGCMPNLGPTWLLLG